MFRQYAFFLPILICQLFITFLGSSDKLIETVRKTLFSGNNAQIECKSWTMAVWFHENLRNPVSISKILILSNVSNQNAGTYYCLGDHLDGAGYFIDSVEVVVVGGK